MTLESTIARKQRKLRQKERMRSSTATLRDALLLVQIMSSGDSKNDPASTLRNINAVVASALAATE